MEPEEAGVALSLGAQALLKSLDMRIGLRQGDVASVDLENFMYDVGPPKSTAEQSMRASSIADELRIAAAAESRLVVTEALGEYEGHIFHREHVLSGNLSRSFLYPEYLPLLGDDLMLFISLRLALMPLYHIPEVWSTKEKKYRLRTSASAPKFHRSFAGEIAYSYGDCRSELWRWRDAFIAFLTKKLPEGRPSEFK